MITDRREIKIKSSPAIVFELIETMPNKFPVYEVLETKPFLFLRLLFVDGLRTAIEAMGVDIPEDELILDIGDTIGPFTLTRSEKPYKYWFTLRSLFFNCTTGYSLYSHHSGTVLNFDLISERPSFIEKMYWFFIKPFHGLFAHKVLRVIKETTEKAKRISQDIEK